jgi:hypothetical protein
MVVEGVVMIDRRRFLLALGASGIAPALLAANRGSGAAFEPLERALVRSGGSARGAYEAGIVGAVAARGRVPDGQPLPPYEIVCGTSIGALNGWFVATGPIREDARALVRHQPPRSPSASMERCSARSSKSRCATHISSPSANAPSTGCHPLHPAAEELPLSGVGFNDEVGVGKAYRLGWPDVGNRGFTDYDWRTFEL